MPLRPYPYIKILLLSTHCKPAWKFLNKTFANTCCIFMIQRPNTKPGEALAGGKCPLLLNLGWGGNFPKDTDLLRKWPHF